MTDAEETARKEFKALVWVGFPILVLLWAGFVWINYYVLMYGGGIDVFIAVAPYCVFPYLIVMSIYAGIFMTTFARGRWKHPWLWGVAGIAMTALFSLGILILLSPIVPYLSPVIFAFVVPVLSIGLILRLIAIRKRVSL